MVQVRFTEMSLIYISSCKYVCIIIDDRFNDILLVKNVINSLSNEALVFIMEFGNFNIVFNQCLLRGLETFNFMSVYPSINMDLIIVFGEGKNVDTSKLHSKCTPMININNNSEVNYVCSQCSKLVNIKFHTTKQLTSFQHFCCHPEPVREIKNATTDLPAELTMDGKRVRSFQFIDENDTDLFLDKCCKTFSEMDVKRLANEPKDPIWDNHKEIGGEHSKFMQVMLVEIKRLGFREKKEEFKKQIKKSRSTSSSIHNQTESKPEPKRVENTKPCLAICKASTKKKGSPCHNSALPGSNYCGIPSHKKLEDSYSAS